MKKIFNISIIISLFIFAGCKKILDENPKGLVSTNNFYNTIDEATAGLIGTYSFLQPIYDAPSLIFASEMATDILTVPSSYNADRIWISYDKFDFNASDAFIFGTYRAAYQLIGSSNTLIASLKNKKLPGDSTKKPIIEGEAHFLRALTYFNLVRWFGGVPLVTIPLKDIPSAYVSRATEDEVYALILSDLNFAVNNLKETSEGVGRANKLAALTLLGKVQLTRKSYTDALNTLKLVVGKRSLYPKYGDVFKLNNENNIVESIFEVQYGISPENNQIVQYSLPVDISGHGFVYGIFAVPTTFINSFETADSTRLNVNAFNSWNGNMFGDMTWRLKKYIDALVPGIQATDAGEINFPVLRYADVLLMLAEAQNEIDASPGAEAYNYINQVRRRAGIPDLVSGLTKDQFRTAILQERAKEFIGEGHRWFDLKRTNNLAAFLGTMGFKTGVNEVFPIPQSEINANKNLVQNPGY